METFSKRFNVGEVPSRLEIDVEDYASVTVMYVGGTVNATGFVAAYEGSLDSTNKESGSWSAILGQTAAGATPGPIASETFGLNVGQTVVAPRQFNVAGLKRFRIRATAITAGNLIAIVTASKVQAAFVPPTPPTTVGINAVSPGTGATQLGKAEDAVAASGDTGIAVLGVRVGTTPAVQTSGAGDYGAQAITAEGKTVIAGRGAEELTWMSRVDITTTTDVLVKAAGAAGVINYLTDLILENTGAASARIVVKNGTGSVLTFTIPAGQTLVVNLTTPYKMNAATAINAAFAAGSGTVTVHALGYLGV